MSGADDAKIFMAVQDFPAPPVTGSNALWCYHKKGTIGGVPVSQKDKDLNISTQKQLVDAFQLNSQINVWTGWLSPQFPQDLIKYKEIKQAEADNKCLIIEHQLQYSAAKDAYLVLVTYANLQFQLNDRYSFYKQDLIHE